VTASAGPWASASERVDVPPVPRGLTARKISESSADGGRPVVLIVEDEPMIALHLQSILEGNGYNVLGPVGTVDEALRLHCGTHAKISRQTECRQPCSAGAVRQDHQCRTGEEALKPATEPGQGLRVHWPPDARPMQVLR
jgi:hypothetical protein